MNRLNQILAGILVVQLLVAAAILWPRPAGSAGQEVSLFPELETDQVVGLTISSADGQRIHLAKDGSDWVLADADGYPVLADRVPPLLTKIAGLKAERLVTQTAGSHKRLGVAEDSFERLVELEMADGSLRRLYVGTSPSYSVTHIRAEGEDEVYLTSDLSAQDAGVQATDWVERTFFSVPSDQVVAFTLENADGRFEFERLAAADESGQDSWSMQGLADDEVLNPSSVQTLLNRATSVPLLAPLGLEEKAAYGLDDPRAVVILHTQSDEDGARTYTLYVGAQDPADKTYVVASSESPYYVRVNEFAVRDLVEKVRADLLQPPPTPLPGATPGGQ